MARLSDNKRKAGRHATGPGKAGALSSLWRNMTKRGSMHPHRHTVKDLAPSLLGWGPASDVITHKNHTHLPKLRSRAQRARRRAQAAEHVFARDGWRCRKCNRDGWLAWKFGFECLTVDHIIPQACGGTDDLFNLTTLCRPCNTRRGAYLPDPVTLL